MAVAIGGTVVAPWVADCSVEHPTVAQFRAAGAVGVIRYMDPGRNDGTEITAQEIADYHANNFPYGLVMEYSADWLEGGYTVGHADALAGLTEEARLGIPRGVTYLASDFDIQPSQYGPALACLQGAADAYGGWAYVGVYGSKSFCEWVGANSPITKFWSTDAWSNFVPASNASLHQHANWPAGVPVVPGCDHNLILADWAPRNTTEDDLTPAQDAKLTECVGAILQLAGVVTKLQTSQNALAQSVIHGDATHYSLDHLARDMASLLAKAGVTDPAVLTALGDLKTAVAAIPAGTGGTIDPAAVADAVVTGVRTLAFKAS